ncbi:polyribonucleotide nucleotidyltransferase [Marinilabilia salmonicolor]|jgi:polyribonucleotide nucleotidyltransferase|uniref:Polyribonucleotide nucleotidyltransferase n=1 Tax=Marinilabilia salmonicolor TaxID=989 RepID=A0A2T0XA76_9BACT|nr:polyribonucleotide nucleotidyltransferase [Marinilabilia salmonicolor]PRY95794.1 polyribonucleotide nucleotidyltransferase [Marinilabilia salmonicolor]RCW36570.1 polyribonucleotide nucleotidyltransferase [Marinilabilia salmonicolor]
MIKPIEKSIDLGDGRSIVIETGKLAKQADGSVVVRMGNTYLLATVVSAKEAKPDVDFMPLSVDYREKYSAIGRFPGGFLKREGRPSDFEILVSRLIDRALRPLFPEDYHADTFVNVSLISADNESVPDSLAGLAASAALTISDIPFAGPISEVRVARVNGELKINPSASEMKEADLEIMVAASMDNIMMVEGEMKEVSEAELLEAMKFAHDAIKVQCAAQIELAEMVNVTKREYSHEVNDEELRKKVWDATYEKAREVARSANPNKHERLDGFASIVDEFIESNYDAEEDEIPTTLIKKYFHDVEKDAVRRVMLDENVRLDGRAMDEIRPIWCEVDCIPGPHGSAIFTRGETQSLTTVTLGSKLDEKLVDDVLYKGYDRFLLHYNFPPFSTGDAKPYRGVGRREIGHGNLAHRALKGMLPDETPYVIRVVSDILESNGSSSMATVCAGTMALMDAGIPFKKPVSGIAMGLITDKDSDKYVVLSDILGDEDHLGDMDFKVTGTVDGITATQMDIKVDGLSYEVLEKALEQARRGRLHILDKITETISEPREDYKPHAPRIVTLRIPKDMIGAVIGPGGKIIQEIQAETNTSISIDEDEKNGIVGISASDKDAIDKALNRIKGIVAVPEVGTVYTGKVKSIVPFGAFVEILPGKDGLLHISEIEWRRLEKVEDVLKEGDMVEVKLIDVDQRSGKLKLSRKVLLPRPERN